VSPYLDKGRAIIRKIKKLRQTETFLRQTEMAAIYLGFIVIFLRRKLRNSFSLFLLFVSFSIIMKKLLFYSLTLMMGLLLSGAGCNPQDTFVTESDFYGRWERDFTVTIASDMLIGTSTHPDYPYSYTMENLVWTPITNPSGEYKDTYPIGYKITGELTQLSGSGYTPVRADGFGLAAVGDIAVDWWYISTNKRFLCLGYRDSEHEGGWSGFTKQK
jgi:hypothetical protein